MSSDCPDWVCADEEVKEWTVARRRIAVQMAGGSRRLGMEGAGACGYDADCRGKPNLLASKLSSVAAEAPKESQ